VALQLSIFAAERQGAQLLWPCEQRPASCGYMTCLPCARVCCLHSMSACVQRRCAHAPTPRVLMRAAGHFVQAHQVIRDWDRTPGGVLLISSTTFSSNVLGPSSEAEGATAKKKRKSRGVAGGQAGMEVETEVGAGSSRWVPGAGALDVASQQQGKF